MSTMRALIIFCSIGLWTLLFSACDTPAPSPLFPVITFTHLAPLNFDAGKLEIVNNYQAPVRAANIEHELPVTPEAAIHRWAKDRIGLLGGERTLRITILEASVIGTQLNVKKGLEGLFFKEQAARYSATLSVRIEVRSARGYQDSMAEATVKRSQTVAEETSPHGLDQVLFNLTEAVVQDLDRTLEANIQKHMGRDLR